MTWMFHPFEIAVCGHSGSGKTTLIARLIDALAPTHRVGYAKHSGHDFQIDEPGKDTDLARAAGAVRTFITNDCATAMTTNAAPDFVQRRIMFHDCDFVIAEGWKSSPLPRIVMLDAAGEILRETPGEKAGPVLAWVGTGTGASRLQRPNDVPFFERDDIAGIAAFIRQYFDTQVRATPLYGVVLAGGRSTRMQKDKASLTYRGRSQLEGMFELVGRFCARAFVVARANQWEDDRFAALPQIHDTIQNCGPTGGILSAMQVHPEAAWLVVACDLPHLDAATLEDLLRQRAPLKVATAYTSAHDGFPEPLCAIYEPRARSRLFQFLAIGYNCPRKMLINSNVRLLTLANRMALENVNHPDEYEAAVRALAGQA